MTASYRAIGRRIVESEQGGKGRAAYGTKLIARLAADLTRRFGCGFGVINLAQMHEFYQTWPTPEILQTPSEKSARTEPVPLLSRFPLSWSHYVMLVAVEKHAARAFYEAEVMRGGWTVRQLDRQLGTSPLKVSPSVTELHHAPGLLGHPALPGGRALQALARRSVLRTARARLPIPGAGRGRGERHARHSEYLAPFMASAYRFADGSAIVFARTHPPVSELWGG